MSYQRTYNATLFDADTRTLSISVTATLNGEEVANDPLVNVVIPIDANGVVLVDAELESFLNDYILSVMPDSYLDAQLALTTYGVVNSAAMYQLTSDVEYESTDIVTPPAGVSWIPVIIFPDTVYTPTGGVYTRSVIAPVGGFNGVPYTSEVFQPDPLARVGGDNYSLEPALINGSILHYIHHSRSALSYVSSVNITGDIDSVLAPDYIIASYPKIWNQPNASLIPAHSTYTHLFYVEHEELTIPVSYARAWIEYPIS